MESRLNSEGFIQQYLIAGLSEEAFIDHTKDTNQLRYEKYLRSIITRKQDQDPGNGGVELGKTSTLVCGFKYILLNFDESGDGCLHVIESGRRDGGEGMYLVLCICRSLV